MKNYLILMLCGIIFSLAFMTSCDDNKEDATIITEVVNPSGGEVKSRDNALTVNIPEGAFVNKTSLTISESATNDHPGGIGKVYEISADQKQFDTPLTLSFKYDPSKLTDGKSPEFLRVFYRENGSEWTVQPGAKLNKTQKTISVNTNHFSEWYVEMATNGYIELQLDNEIMHFTASQTAVNIQADGVNDTLFFKAENERHQVILNTFDLSFDNIPSEQNIPMCLDIDDGDYYGSINVIFDSFQNTPGGLIIGHISGELTLKDLNQKTPVTGKLVFQLEKLE